MTEPSPQKTLSLIGLGLLGSAVARRWKKMDWEVIGYDVSQEACDRFRESGGTVESNLETCLMASERSVFCLPEADVSREVLNSVFQLSENSRPAFIIDMATGAPDLMEDNFKLCQQYGIGYLDACVGGASSEAEAGDAILLVGGTVEAVETNRSVLEDVSRQVFHVGPAGQGARMKLVTNLVLGLERLALAEGLSFAKTLGFDLQATLEVLQAGPARSHVMTTKGAKMVSQEWTPQARLDQHWKDVRLILEESRKRKTHLPLTQLHDQILEKCHHEGWGELDNSAVIRAYWT
ncbi:MAG: NAD(P)-dependent oxidoreductase [Planctomycetaceae bacterium]|nr:NAD(P)-dependent oxidoreductase [Planctomycetaceae bacterium]